MLWTHDIFVSEAWNAVERSQDSGTFHERHACGAQSSRHGKHRGGTLPPVKADPGAKAAEGVQ